MLWHGVAVGKITTRTAKINIPLWKKSSRRLREYMNANYSNYKMSNFTKYPKKLNSMIRRMKNFNSQNYHVNTSLKKSKKLSS